jgi:site-specific DNA recombinase
MKNAAIYARVSSDKQKEENTIASQTAALKKFAHTHGFIVPEQWVFEDDGYSGASLVRPGLEKIRDLAAEGHIQTVLVYSPDRLSRKYAYQVLLTEEFGRYGVDTVFIRAPQSSTPEDQLLLQFQGMIAEYERAQILERSRRGKRYRAKAGEVGVLSCAPYGYRYIRKRDGVAARFEVIATEAEIVHLMFEKYTLGGLSIGAIARLLNEQGVPTRREAAGWERSTVWGMLRNPAYKGTACFGKTQKAPRQRITRPLRLSGRCRHGETTGCERPRAEWIEIPVPPIISEETFALAQERLADNKQLSLRRTIEPSLLQGLVSCKKCGYALYRTSTRTSARKIHYYRCLGSDGWRYLGGSQCDSRPIRQDLLDSLVWTEVVKLLEDPTLINAELNRRLAAARATEPTRRRQETLERDLTRVTRGMERLVTAYQEDLVSLDELRSRMPDLRRREHVARAELKSIGERIADSAEYLRLAETLTAFLKRLRTTAHRLDIIERQRVVRLLVKEVLATDDSIVICHSIPVQHRDEVPSPLLDGRGSLGGQSYLLCTGRHHRPLGRARFRCPHLQVFQNLLLEETFDQIQNSTG